MCHILPTRKIVLYGSGGLNFIDQNVASTMQYTRARHGVGACARAPNSGASNVVVSHNKHQHKPAHLLQAVQSIIVQKAITESFKVTCYY